MKKKNPPFPQANNLELIYSIFSSLPDNGISKFDIMNRYHLHERQGAYYLDSLLFLDVVEKINTKYFVKPDVEKIIGNVSQVSRESFARLILKNSFLKQLYFEIKDERREKERKEYIAARIKGQYSLGANTAERRASSIVNWFAWIEKYMDGEAGE